MGCVIRGDPADHAKCVGKQPNRVAEGRVVGPGKKHERDETDPQRDEHRRNDEHRPYH
jgi:hypothetical protein